MVARENVTDQPDHEAAALARGFSTADAVAGIVGGIAGTAAFGLLMTALDLGFVRSFVPAIYGLEQTGAVGWTIHLLHGAILGLVFAALITRPIVVEMVVPDPDVEHIGPLNTTLRVAAAGIVFGLAVWALLPMVVLPVWVGAVGGQEIDAVSGTASQSLAGHFVFGTVLGVIYATVLHWQ